jgi:hypothetical protein
MGHFDEAEEKEKEKKEKNWEYQQRAKAGMWEGDKTVLGDLKEEKQKMIEQTQENFMAIDSIRRYMLVGLAFKAEEELSGWKDKKILNGDELMRIILGTTEEILRRAEVGYVIKVMINKGFINHTEQKNLPLTSKEQKYETNR